MLKYDSIGRITYNDDEGSGHSVCTICGKDMPVCWDVVCSQCFRTVCYKCAVDIDGFWFCRYCRPMGVCDRCGFFTTVFLAPDPFPEEVWPEEPNEESWWCEDCYQERRDNI